MDEATPKKFYDLEASSYDVRRSGRGSQYNDRCQKRIIDAFLGNQKKIYNILEVAPGTGRITEYLLLKSESTVIHAVDLSDEMIDILNSRFGSEERFSSEVCDITEFVPKRRFDLIIFVNAASHMSDFEGVISNCSKWLEPGGLLLFNFPNFVSPYFPIGIFIKLSTRSLFRKVWTRWYSPREVEKVLSDNGFVISARAGFLHHALGMPDLFVPILNFFNNLNSIFSSFGTQVFVFARKS